MPIRDLVIEKTPPEKRQKSCAGDKKRHLYEPAVMLAVADWMFDSGAQTVRMSPDGMHAKQFDIRGCLETQGFKQIDRWGHTNAGSRYTRHDHTLEVDFKPGQGDVVADVREYRIWVETKGGFLNTKHAGQMSKLRRGLYEAVGMLLNGSKTHGVDRLIAAVPHHPETEKLSQQMAQRCQDTGIEIAWVFDKNIQLIAGSMDRQDRLL
ncbi:MAG: hypothetical protein OXD33_11780 [Rhodobacteraceae bacterium]|nr:hypothetical protein [Paracoccaceae bacterium]